MSNCYSLHHRLIAIQFAIADNNNVIRHAQEDNRALQLEYNETLHRYNIAKARETCTMCQFCERPAVKRGLCDIHAKEIFTE